MDYRPELDVSEELDYEEANYYQSQIGILRWMVELGRVDIMVEVSMLSSHLALPRRGHLDAVFRIYAYLKCHHNASMVFDPTYNDIDLNKFRECPLLSCRCRELVGEANICLTATYP